MKKLLFNLIMNNDIQILQKNKDWYAFLTASISEKLEGYLFKLLLLNKAILTIPKPISKILYISYRYNQIKNRLYLREFQQIKYAIEKEGIQLYPYRGLFLITDVYNDYGMRYMEDIDVLSSEKNCIMLEPVLKKLKYDLLQINNTDRAVYTPLDIPIDSCLFIKKNLETNLVPFVKLDISPLFIADNKTFTYTKNGNLSPEYMFLLICKSFFEDACKKNICPLPNHITLVKLIDLLLFAKKYPQEAEYILKDSYFSNIDSIIFTNQCIEYFSNKETRHEY